MKDVVPNPKVFVSSSIKTYYDGASHTIKTDCFCVINEYGDDAGAGTPYLSINGARVPLQIYGDYSGGGGHQRMLFLPCKKGTVLRIENSTTWTDYGSTWTEIELVS